MNINSWREDESPERPERIKALVDEFLSSLSEDLKVQFKKNYQWAKEKGRKIANFKMSAQEIYKGNMVSYAEIFGDQGSISSCGQGIGFFLEHEGKKYYIDDLYCLNPQCECKKVTLLFYQQDNEKKSIVQLFDAELDFKNRLTVEGTQGCTKEEAKRIFTLWQESDPDAFDILKYRYQEMKKIGEKLISENESSQELSNRPSPILKKEKIGRNMPCPCGSGLKYKKCCGK